jgi:hypothetical protein
MHLLHVDLEIRISSCGINVIDFCCQKKIRERRGSKRTLRQSAATTQCDGSPLSNIKSGDMYKVV